MTNPHGDVTATLSRARDTGPKLPIIGEPIPGHLTTLTTWRAQIRYGQASISKWRRDPLFPPPVARFRRRGKVGQMPLVYRRTDLDAYLSARRTASGIPVIDQPLPDHLITLACWADEIDYARATVETWTGDRRFPRPVAMLHGKCAVYQRAELTEFAWPGLAVELPTSGPLPAGLTTLEEWAAVIGRAPATVRGWSHERNFPRPAAKRGRQGQRVYRRSDLEAYRLTDPRPITLIAWAKVIGRDPATVQRWSRMPGFPEPVGSRGARRVYRRGELDSQLPWSGRPRPTGTRAVANG